MKRGGRSEWGDNENIYKENFDPLVSCIIL